MTLNGYVSIVVIIAIAINTFVMFNLVPSQKKQRNLVSFINYKMSYALVGIAEYITLCWIIISTLYLNAT